MRTVQELLEAADALLIRADSKVPGPAAECLAKQSQASTLLALAVIANERDDEDAEDADHTD